MKDKLTALEKYIEVYHLVGTDPIDFDSLFQKVKDANLAKSYNTNKSKAEAPFKGECPMLEVKDNKTSLDIASFRTFIEDLCKYVGTDAAVLFTGPAPAPKGRKGEDPLAVKVPNNVENPQFAEYKKRNTELKNEVAALKTEKEELQKQLLKIKSENILAVMTEPVVRIDTACVVGKDVKEDIFLHNVSDIFPGERDCSKTGGRRESFYRKDDDKNHLLSVENAKSRIAGLLCRCKFFEKLLGDCENLEKKKSVKGEITSERISANRKKSIELLLADKTLCNQAKLALYAGWHEYHGTELEDLLNYAGDHGLNAEYVIRLLEMPNVANNYENVRGFLRQICKASEARMKREAAKELIAGEWFVVAEYNDRPCRFQMLPMDELISFERYLKQGLYSEAVAELDKLLGTYRKSAFLDDDPEKKLVVKSAGFHEVNDDYYADASEMIHQYEALTGINANVPIEDDSTSDDFKEYEEGKDGSK